MYVRYQNCLCMSLFWFLSFDTQRKKENGTCLYWAASWCWEGKLIWIIDAFIVRFILHSWSFLFTFVCCSGKKKIPPLFILQRRQLSSEEEQKNDNNDEKEWLRYYKRNSLQLNARLRSAFFWGKTQRIGRCIFKMFWTGVMVPNAMEMYGFFTLLLPTDFVNIIICSFHSW